VLIFPFSLRLASGIDHVDTCCPQVDAHVGEALFTKVFLELLAGKTRILVTNSLRHLSQVDRVLVMHGGKIVQDGAWQCSGCTAVVQSPRPHAKNITITTVVSCLNDMCCVSLVFVCIRNPL